MTVTPTTPIYHFTQAFKDRWTDTNQKGQNRETQTRLTRQDRTGLQTDRLEELDGQEDRHVGQDRQGQDRTTHRLDKTHWQYKKGRDRTEQDREIKGQDTLAGQDIDQTGQDKTDRLTDRDKTDQKGQDRQEKMETRHERQRKTDKQTQDLSDNWMGKGCTTNNSSKKTNWEK